MADSLENRAKRYSCIKYSLEIFETVYLLALLFVFAASGTSKLLVQNLALAVPCKYLSFPLFLLVTFILYYILTFPLNYYQGFILEHKFSLTKQKIGDWLFDQLKSSLIAYVILVILAGAFYLILRIFPHFWWLAISLFWIFFTVVFAKLLPVIIIPLFFKYKKLTDEALRGRIMGLAEKMGVRILDVFEIDFSKKTLKANAAFVGVGKTRRVLLADTLKDKYSHDEIVVILAHEFAHYKLKHLLKLIVVNSFATVLIFYMIFVTCDFVLRFFGFNLLSDIAALPIIFIYFVIFGVVTRPLEAFVSRCFEREADALALKTTGLRLAFISMMEKLGDQNLADKSPHPIIKFFFFDHPPIDERIGTVLKSK